MDFAKLKLNGLVIIKPNLFIDDRGFFFESFHKQKYQENGIDIDIVQQNHSRSKKNILRGLHYQIKNSQGKLVRVLKGEIFDVAVDLRKNSTTFGKWESVVLSEENKQLLWIPAGFAHGFFVISDWAEVEYSTTDIYSPEYERTIIWDDSDLNIAWPIPDDEHPILSTKDSKGILFKDAEIYE